MKRIIFIFLSCFILFLTSVNASLSLSGKTIVIDAGHGFKDNGTSYNNVIEKDLNLQISKYLEKELIKEGAKVLMTREGDYDLSSPNVKRRKRSDFDNRIEFINKSKADIYLSIHINYLNDKSYSGSQVFYEESSKKLAESIQKHLNTVAYPRSIKKMPEVYMYDKLNIKGVLIECGFISNKQEREKLQLDSYQELLAKKITKGIIDYYK